MRDKPRRRLGLFGWIKARVLERKLRRRWKTDADWRASVQGVVSATAETIIKQRMKPQTAKQN